MLLDTPRINGPECLDILGVAPKLAQGFRPIRTHFLRMMQRAVDLFFQIERSAIPELPKVKPCIKHRWGIDWPLGAAETHRTNFIVRPARLDVMTRATRYGVIF